MSTPETIPSDLALQLAIAKELPELIGHVAAVKDETNGFYWNEGARSITPREWDWIVRELVARLTDEELNLYAAYYWDLCLGNRYEMVRGHWPKRAMSYFHIKGIEPS